MNNIKLLSDPTDIFIGSGWCHNLSKILWNKNTIEKNCPNNFDKYVTKIQNEINFQCVIMAQYDWGRLFIDTCDSAEWFLDNIDDNDICLKLQYNPNIEYPNNVKKFTYATHDPIKFDSNLETYRQLYKEQIKTNLVYGRWIAVSLQRYNLAKKMRSVGIMNGGEYCTSSKGTGYDDHEEQGLLDFIKPRERMSWDEYFNYQSFALASIDAAGFGDCTHRMIENLAIGIPLIRPKLKNETINTLVADYHYLDCGENGEYIENCIARIRDDNFRNYLIKNGLEWYENNASPVSIQNLVLQIINNKIKYGHIYLQQQFGEDWFSYPKLYSEMVNKFPTGSHFVEIGSWKGKSSSYMAVEIANSNKKITFDCIDTWQGSPEHGDTFKNNDVLYNIFLDNMKNIKDYYKPIRMTSLEAANIYDNESLDFIFIDAEHSYEAVKKDILAWLPKLKCGGVIAGHDYVEISWPGVIKAVDECLGKENISTQYDCWIYHKK